MRTLRFLGVKPVGNKDGVSARNSNAPSGSLDRIRSLSTTNNLTKTRMRSLGSMGFRVINPPGPPGQAAWVVYDLDFDTAYEWHQSGCRGADCWCDGLSGVAFLEALHREVLGKARYSLVSAPPGTVAKGSIRLSTGPGIQNKDLTPLEETIRAN